MEIAPGVLKTLVYPGVKDSSGNLYDNSKATFNFKTIKIKDSGEEIVIDDSKKKGKPMEIIFGKQFKMPVWECCIRSMFTKEVSRFEVDRDHVTSYPFVSQSYRQYSGDKPGKPLQKCCGLMAYKMGLGYADLNEMFQKPCNLTFIIELISIEKEGSYKKETWAMEPNEKLDSVPMLKEAGNKLYNEGKYSDAGNKYQEALYFLETLSLREKPGDEEWKILEDKKIPLLLNFSQCKLLEKDYYTAIEHTTTVIKKEPDNVKALFRRAKAHKGAWNPDEAKKDFLKVKVLDPKLSALVDKEMKDLERAEIEKKSKDRECLQGKIF